MAEWWEAAPIAAPDNGAWWKDAPIYKPKKPGVVEDVARTLPAATVRSAAGAAGTPAGVMDMVDTAWQWAVSKGLQATGVWTPEQAEAARKPIPGLEDGHFRGIFPRAKVFTEATEKAVGEPLYKPQTTTGEYVGTAVEMAPAALFPGTAAQRVAQVAVPAVASETAGQAARRIAPSAETGARVIGALGGGLGAAAAQTPRTARALIREAAPNLDDATVTAARQLIDDAGQRGVHLTWPEAIQQVTGGGTRLGDIQRVVEQSRGGGDVLRPFMAERPAQVQGAGNAAIAQFADVPLEPGQTAIRAQQAAAGTIDETQAAINAATRPAYQAAEGTRLGPQVHAALLDDPIYAQTLQEIRRTPALNGTIAHLPDDAVGVVDMVQRRMREAAENARVPGQASTSNTAALNYENARAPAIAAAETATGGPTGPYAVAREAQAHLRENVLEPMQRGPTGAIAAKEGVLEQARALLPNQPAAGVDAAVSQTVRQIVRRDPDAAQNLVRTYAQSIFDEAIQSNIAGPNQFGGAKFAAVIAGNPQQARNLEAAVRALPNGHARWDGFRRFLDIVEATGQRQPAGSQTAFNQAIQERLKSGGVTGELANVVATGGIKAPARLTKWYEELRLGRNTDQLARIFTDPGSEALLRQLAREPVGTARAQGIALRLTYLAEQARQKPEANPVR